MKLMKWPGSKLRASRFVIPVVSARLRGHSVYVVPFWGSGALSEGLWSSGALQGVRVVANDYNPHIVNLWKVLQSPGQTEELLSYLHRMTTDAAFHQLNDGEWRACPTKSRPDRKLYISEEYQSYFLSVRDQLNQRRTPGSIPHPSPIDAARFLFFNRTCFNGLWRESAKSGLNVPVGRKSDGNYMQLPVWDAVISAGEWIREIDIVFYNQDWEKFLDTQVYAPKVRAEVYCDPPYHNKFVKYNENGFSADVQADLAVYLFELAAHTGSDIVVSNSADAAPFYVESQGWNHQFFDSKTSVSCGAIKDDMSELIAVLDPPQGGIRCAE